MKLNKKLLTAITAPALTAVALAPVAVLASCGNRSYIQEFQEQVVSEFKKLCDIPHSSDKILLQAPISRGQVWKMSCYLYDRFVQILGPQTVNQDAWGNLWFDIPANDDAFKNYPRVGLQAHMDMVFNYDDHQYEKEPDPTKTKIECVDEVVDGKRILHSKDYKTTLGADDGIGVATIIALAQTKTIKHGPLRGIITNCEEKAMQGAEILVGKTEEGISHPEAVSDLKYLVNLDGEDLGDVCVGCSGGVGSYYDQVFAYEPITTGYKSYQMGIWGFQGGHSGTDVANFLGNPIQLGNELLKNLYKADQTLEIVDMETPGVTVYNKIPDACVITVACKNLTAQNIKDIFDDVLEAYSKTAHEPGDKRANKPDYKYGGEDWQTISDNFFVVEDELGTNSIKGKDVETIINFQDSLFFGIESWPTEEETAKFSGLQTSANIGPVSFDEEFTTAEGKTYVPYSCASYSRSTDKERVVAFHDQNVEVSTKILGETIIAGPKAGKSTYSSDAQFPSWENNNMDMSKLAHDGWLAAGVDSSKVQYSRTHGGIENAWWYNATGGAIKQTSIGAQLHDCHEVKETCEVDTIIPFVKTVEYILQHVNELESK